MKYLEHRKTAKCWQHSSCAMVDDAPSALGRARGYGGAGRWLSPGAPRDTHGGLTRLIALRQQVYIPTQRYNSGVQEEAPPGCIQVAPGKPRVDSGPLDRQQPPGDYRRKGQCNPRYRQSRCSKDIFSPYMDASIMKRPALITVGYGAGTSKFDVTRGWF